MATTFTNQTSLSADGVNVISLSAPATFIAYNPVSPLNGVLDSVTLNGSTFLIDTAYIGSDFALLTPPNGFTLFTLLTGGGTSVIPASAVLGIWTDENRRMHWLGYY